MSALINPIERDNDTRNTTAKNSDADNTGEDKGKIRPEILKAVALFYDEDNAPTVTAKGRGVDAEEIVAIAQANDVPLCENPMLADLLEELDVGEHIPESVYTAVAHIISFAYHIRGIQLGDKGESNTNSHANPDMEL